MSDRDQLQTQISELGVTPADKVAPDDPTLDLVPRKGLDKKKVKLILGGFGAIFAIAVVASLAGGDDDPAAARAEDGEVVFGAQVPRFLDETDELYLRDVQDPDPEFIPPAEAEDFAPVRFEVAERYVDTGAPVSDTQPSASQPPVRQGPIVATTTPAPTQSQSMADQIEAQRLQSLEQGRTSGLFAGGSGVSTGGSGGAGSAAAQAQTAAAQATVEASTVQAELMNQTDAQRQNLQRQNAEWLASRQSDFSGYLDATASYPVAPGAEIKAGTLVPIVMITGINSDLPGPIVAQIIEPVFDTLTGQNVLVPAGSRVVGSYSSTIAFGQERVLIAWDRIIRPDGVSLNIGGMQGVDAAGQSGLSDQVDRHIAEIAAAVGLSTGFELGTDVVRAFLSSNVYLRALSEISESGDAGDVGSQFVEQYAERVLNRQPTLTIRPGFRGNIFVSRDIIMPVYTGIGGGLL